MVRALDGLAIAGLPGAYRASDSAATAAGTSPSLSGFEVGEDGVPLAVPPDAVGPAGPVADVSGPVAGAPSAAPPPGKGFFRRLFGG